MSSSGLYDVAKDLTSASFGSFLCAYTGQPFDTVKVRLQSEQLTLSKGGSAIATGPLTMTGKIVKGEGLAALWKGVIPTGLGMVAEVRMSLFFVSLVSLYVSVLFVCVLCGLRVGLFASIFGLEVLVGAIYGSTLTHTRHERILNKKPFDNIQNATAFTMNEGLKRFFDTSDNFNSPMKSKKDDNILFNFLRHDMVKPFAIGCASGFASAIVLIPSEVIKSRTQMETNKSVGSFQIFKRCIKNHGVRSMFCGLDAQVSESMNE